MDQNFSKTLDITYIFLNSIYLYQKKTDIYLHIMFFWSDKSKTSEFKLVYKTTPSYRLHH